MVTLLGSLGAPVIFFFLTCWHYQYIIDEFSLAKLPGSLVVLVNRFACLAVSMSDRKLSVEVVSCLLILNAMLM